MDLKILAFLILYWSLWIGLSLTVIHDVSPNNNLINAELNTTALSNSETSGIGLLAGGVSFSVGRFVPFALFGVGWPDGTPQIVKSMGFVFSSGMTLLTIGFILASLWNG